MKSEKLVPKVVLYTPCPLCGSQPTLVSTSDPEKPQYKYFCTGNSIHVSCGNWFSNPVLAEKDWEKRVRDRYQPELYRPTNYEVIKQTLKDIDADMFAELLLDNDWFGLFDIPKFETAEELANWLNAEHKKILNLKFIGTDSHERPIYEDAYGNIWKDCDPRNGEKAKLCQPLNGDFDGEPDIPMDAIKFYDNMEIIFEPQRYCWGTTDWLKSEAKHK